MNSAPENEVSVVTASAIGSGAILLWSSLAVLTTLVGPVPPFQLVALTFGIAFALSLVTWWLRGDDVRAHLRLPAAVWALGIFGLFGYHAAYFTAFALAPPVEVNLVNYLWPLLIVIFAGLLPGERLTMWHLAGAVAGFAGCVLLLGDRLAAESHGALGGYAAAVAAALIWSSYSVLSRRFGAVPTDAVGAFCGATAALALIAHLVFEQTVWPHGAEWLIVLAMGIGPVGAAFFLWDIGMKRGDIKALGALSYATPLLSTLLLIVFGPGTFSLHLLLATALIVGGAAIASRDLWRARSD